MTELLPPVQAAAVQRHVLDYLTTTFALTDVDAEDALDRFLADDASGIFKGPYVRLRLPFKPADESWREALEWHKGFPPYGHQAEAFRRLASQRAGQPRRPEPTLVTTGTGSGKTEAFLYPVLDHVLRARRAGVRGMKALVLYPMNALANDQARRLAGILTDHPELSGVTAALYTGQAGPSRTLVSAEGLITDRDVIRSEAPDIVLTNYKMLDQMLLRERDQRIWQQSATSLQYLVLDEFHTYDGAQGTDVAMLLRRLGLTLKSHWTDDEPSVTAEDRARPLGRVTPVATSATLGDGGDPTAMLGFAERVFGEPFGDDAVVTESRFSLEEWAGPKPDSVGGVVEATALDVHRVVAALDDLGPDPDGADLARTVLRHLYDEPLDPGGAPGASLSPSALLALTQAHPLVRVLAEAARDAVSLDALVDVVLGESGALAARTAGRSEAWTRVLAAVIGMLGHVRAVCGREALSVDLHLWVRELTRIDRAADAATTFRWGDDGPPVADDGAQQARPSWPAIYCRHCGRSGWGHELAPTGQSLTTDDGSVRRNHARREGRFRPFLAAVDEDTRAAAGETVEGLRWLSVRGREVLTTRPDDEDDEVREGWVLPVLTLTGKDADKEGKDDVCPSCGKADGIRFLGSAIATLLSVSLSTLFGSGALDRREKKALVFTDSVQDAAHRAGFVQARSHTLTLRAVLREAVADGPRNLDELVTEVLRRAGDDSFARYRLLPPDCADREISFVPFWKKPTWNDVPTSVRRRVQRRLAFDAVMELGLNSRTGRTLELTGTVAAEVDAGAPSRLVGSARAVLQGVEVQPTFDGLGAGSTDEAALVAWVRGVLDRMRAQGAIEHPWFATYQKEDGTRRSIWFARPRQDGMPAFPVGRPAPGYPRVGGGVAPKRSELDPVTSPQSWYAVWTSRVLGVNPADGGLLAKLLLERLARDEVLTATKSDSGALVYALPSSSVVVHPTTEHDLRAGHHQLACDVCHALTPGTRTVVEQLAGAPCTVQRCSGHLAPSPVEPGFYRDLYASPDMRRVVAREHTSLLEDERRLEYEEGFKSAQDDPQAPNVLVATPTLEMGIDIGDLSAVFLASLPRTVASYVQRVGRAGRLTGNALTLAYVTGRGEHLPKLGDPLSVINGAVRPPATYLGAEEILRRQYTASVADELARDAGAPHPQGPKDAIGSAELGSYLGAVIARAEGDPDLAERFVAGFGGGLPDAVSDGLREWARPVAGPGTSPLAAHLHDASTRWQRTVEQLRHRIEAVDAVLPELQAKVESPTKTDDDEQALRSARTGRRMTAGRLAQLTAVDYWIGVLEEHGVLPNYTLLDDTVTLDVGISWMNPDTGDYATDHASIERASAQAIREMAPGATFYARGLEIAVDAVDLGADGAEVRPWVFCPDCGYATDVGEGSGSPAPASCPRCGSTAIADTGQRLGVVEMAHVTAEVRRDEALISDRRDDRTQAPFQVFVAADLDRGEAVREWYLGEGAAGSGFGCTYLRRVVLRWLNAGVPSQGGERQISGERRGVALFRVCAGCGKLDSETGVNKPHEHRPWCPYRRAAEEQVVAVALSRTLRTQGLVLRLPAAVTIGDPFAVPSLSAAVLLGLREQHGGHPDHLQVERVVDPVLTDGTDNADALLVHDVVPGGTGYLAELAGPEQLRALLVAAWDVVRTCECRHEERLACHRCLLPFVRGSADSVSRAAAERHLRRLLGLDEDAESADGTSWETVEKPPPVDPESHLEQRFRSVLVDRLETAGAKVSETPGAWGNTVWFTLPGSPRQWSLRPQVNLLGSKPDFLLESTDTAVPRTAIFVDGRRYHATVQHNRLADDATKREVLRENGYLALGVSADDVTAAERAAAEPGWTAPAPSWWDEGVKSALIGKSAFAASPAAYARLARPLVDGLVDWVAGPDPAERARVARAVPMFLARQATTATLADGLPLAAAAAGVLDGDTAAAGGRSVRLCALGALAVAVEQVPAGLSVAVVLDDRDASLDADHADAWRQWLRLSNHLGLRDWPTVVTTLSRVRTSAPTAAASPVTDVAAPAPDLSVEYQAAYAEATSDDERDLLRALAERGVEVPAMGQEAVDGIPVDLSWPEARLAVEVLELAEEDRAALSVAGWTIVAADVDEVVAALPDAGATKGES
ncbi:DEAD/DEAH box helicase [Pseudokineococcus basanitobsidens]|uniref:DEAD/DEAH box helicase n=1 Tax=Pseudokineococcus basanitobsidens TaxID=1926649 RepID=A0ABU8RFC4_9ACTN